MSASVHRVELDRRSEQVVEHHLVVSIMMSIMMSSLNDQQSVSHMSTDMGFSVFSHRA